MILREKDYIQSTHPQIAAGEKQEKDVAFYLRREFKNEESILILNDLRISVDGENAQIDHLVVYPYGFILIESKSVKGEIKINKHGEWTRSLNGKWSGMPSPLMQAKLQRDLLLKFLIERRDSIYESKFLGLIPQGFGGRQWHSLCAVSSNAIVERDEIPEEISEQVVKSEFLVAKLHEIMNLNNSIIKKLIIDERPWFSAAVLTNIGNVLLQHNNSICKEALKPVNELQGQVPVTSTPESTNTVLKSSNDTVIKCKKCHSDANLTANYGRYGYYVTCSSCSCNTSMKSKCQSCNSSQTRVQKRKDIYSLICDECDSTVDIFLVSKGAKMIS